MVWTNKIDYLYARYQLITYFITYNTDKGEFVDGYRPTSFTVESPVTLDQIPEVVVLVMYLMVGLIMV